MTLIPDAELGIFAEYMGVRERVTPVTYPQMRFLTPIVI
ncbi:hypothetical protein EMIT0P74_30374 [Pseudomonas sp. IT-P74]